MYRQEMDIDLWLDQYEVRQRRDWENEALLRNNNRDIKAALGDLTIKSRRYAEIKRQFEAKRKKLSSAK